MRLRSLFLASVLPLAACGGGGGDFVDGGNDVPRVDSVSPEFGPMSGGTTILVTGNGFLQNGAAPNNVLVGGRMAAAAGAIDDNTLEVVLPAADSPGDAEIVVYNSNGYASATGVFHYSEPPTVEEMTPDVIRYDESATITVTGSGFVDEDAGVNTVLIDGIPAVDVEVESDTELSFTALPGFVFSEPVITVINRRGEGSNSGYQYGPGPAGGIAIFPRFGGFAAPQYMFFFDPLTLELQAVPSKVQQGGGGSQFPFFRTVFKNSSGAFMGVDHESGQLQMMDLDAQTATSQGGVPYLMSDAITVGTTTYAVTKTAQCQSGRFGTVDLSTRVFTQIGTATLHSCGGGTALAADAGGSMFVYFNQNLYPISRTTGVLGTAVPIALSDNLVAMRFLGNVLYGITRGQQVISINTTSGAIEVVARGQQDNMSFIGGEVVIP